MSVIEAGVTRAESLTMGNRAAGNGIKSKLSEDRKALHCRRRNLGMHQITDPQT